MRMDRNQFTRQGNCPEMQGTVSGHRTGKRSHLWLSRLRGIGEGVVLNVKLNGGS